jgi:hypothetical protein
VNAQCPQLLSLRAWRRAPFACDAACRFFTAAAEAGIPRGRCDATGVDRGRGVLILTDMLGDTPTNQSLAVAREGVWRAFFANDRAALEKLLPEGEVRYDPERKPGLANLAEILSALTGLSTDEVLAPHTRYGQLKDACADAIISELDPIRRRHDELMNDPAELCRTIGHGLGTRERGPAVAEAHLGFESSDARRSRPPARNAGLQSSPVPPRAGPAVPSCPMPLASPSISNRCRPRMRSSTA